MLIHHHHIAYVDENGAIWLSSVIGRWIEALADYFGEVGLLLHEGERRELQQDVKVLRPNVKLISLGAPGRTWDHFSRIQRIRRICSANTRGDDMLVVRGITPRQSVVWDSVRARCKYFLLVGTPTPMPLAAVHTPSDLWAFVASRYRLFQLGRIFISGRTLVNAPNLVSILASQFGVQASFVPTNTIHLDEFASEIDIRARALGDPVRLLFCGRVTRSKGIVDLLEALVSLRRFGLKYILDVVGSAGENDHLEFFQHMAQDMGVGEFITWHGQVPYGPQLLAYYRVADILLLPSHAEGFPHVLWEAAASGCAIIASAVGGIPSLLKDGEQALLVPPHSPEALARAVLRIVGDQPLRLKLIGSAYALAHGYTVEACAQWLAEALKIFC